MAKRRPVKEEFVNSFKTSGMQTWNTGSILDHPISKEWELGMSSVDFYRRSVMLQTPSPYIHNPLTAALTNTASCNQYKSAAATPSTSQYHPNALKPSSEKAPLTYGDYKKIRQMVSNGGGYYDSNLNTNRVPASAPPMPASFAIPEETILRKKIELQQKELEEHKALIQKQEQALKNMQISSTAREPKIIDDPEMAEERNRDQARFEELVKKNDERNPHGMPLFRYRPYQRNERRRSPERRPYGRRQSPSRSPARSHNRYQERNWNDGRNYRHPYKRQQGNYRRTRSRSRSPLRNNNYHYHRYPESTFKNQGRSKSPQNLGNVVNTKFPMQHDTNNDWDSELNDSKPEAWIVERTMKSEAKKQDMDNLLDDWFNPKNSKRNTENHRYQRGNSRWSAISPERQKMLDNNNLNAKKTETTMYDSFVPQTLPDNTFSILPAASKEPNVPLKSSTPVEFRKNEEKSTENVNVFVPILPSSSPDSFLKKISGNSSKNSSKIVSSSEIVNLMEKFSDSLPGTSNDNDQDFFGFSKQEQEMPSKLISSKFTENLTNAKLVKNPLYFGNRTESTGDERKSSDKSSKAVDAMETSTKNFKAAGTEKSVPNPSLKFIPIRIQKAGTTKLIQNSKKWDESSIKKDSKKSNQSEDKKESLKSPEKSVPIIDLESDYQKFLEDDDTSQNLLKKHSKIEEILKKSLDIFENDPELIECLNSQENLEETESNDKQQTESKSTEGISGLSQTLQKLIVEEDKSNDNAVKIAPENGLKSSDEGQSKSAENELENLSENCDPDFQPLSEEEFLEYLKNTSDDPEVLEPPKIVKLPPFTEEEFVKHLKISGYFEKKSIETKRVKKPFRDCFGRPIDKPTLRDEAELFSPEGENFVELFSDAWNFYSPLMVFNDKRLSDDKPPGI